MEKKKHSAKFSKNMTANCTDTVNRTVMGHLNLHKRSVCAVDFVNYIDRILGQETSAIYGLQEPNVNPNTSRLSDIANSSLIYCRNSTRGNLPRAALFSTSNISLAPVPNYIDRDISTALWTTRSKNLHFKRIMVTSVYMDKVNHKDSPRFLILSFLF